MTQQQMIIAAIASNIVAILLVWLAWKRKNTARFLFGLLFIWAAWANWQMSHNNPEDYLNYSEYAIGPYKKIINGFFAEHITVLVSAIAICQLFIGIGLMGRGLLVKLSCIAAILFLLAIAPLGFGSAFPFSIIASVALLLIYKHPFPQNIIHNKWLA